jgi:protein FRG1
MSAEKVRSSKLKFKGEKTKKKRKRGDGDDIASTNRHKDSDGADPDTWVFPEEPSHVRGPTFIVHPSDTAPICVTYDSTRRRIILQSLDKDKTDDETEPPPTVLERIPSDISHVWVTTRVAGSSTINLRTGTGEGKFLSCDAHGLVSADREARGPQEEWTPVIMPDGMVAFMNVYEKYLSIDEVAGGSLQLRGDSEEVGFAERFWVKIQEKYKKEANDEEKKKDGQSDTPLMDEESLK